MEMSAWRALVSSTSAATGRRTFNRLAAGDVDFEEAGREESTAPESLY
jgi:hypothetical protein